MADTVQSHAQGHFLKVAVEVLHVQFPRSQGIQTAAVREESKEE